MQLRPHSATDGLRERLGWKFDWRRFRLVDTAREAGADFIPVSSSSDDRMRIVEVVPTGYPVNDWAGLALVLMPYWWLRHRLLHPTEFSVVIHQRGRFWGGWNKTIRRETDLSLDDARARASEWADQLRNT